MKKEEFEWLKNWMTEIIDHLAIRRFYSKGAIETATRKYPPPIDDPHPGRLKKYCSEHDHTMELNEKCPECEEEQG